MIGATTTTLRLHTQAKSLINNEIIPISKPSGNMKKRVVLKAYFGMKNG